MHTLSTRRGQFSMARLSRTQRLAVILMALAGLSYATPSFAQSVFTQKPDDPGAAVFNAENFQAKGDGVADDSDAFQTAVNRARGGILLIPEGRYRLSKTIIVPTGTRLIGYGKNRPVFVLGANTPGFQKTRPGYPLGEGVYMIHFAQSRQADGTVVDASELDFNSAMNNIDFEVAEGNPAAVCVRFHVAQHSYLNNMNFKLGSALAAMEDIGNQSANVKITGGKYGIISTRTSPNWQFILMDSAFEGQSVAGVRTQDVGFSFIRCNFSNMPVAIDVPENETDQIYGKDLRFENISKAGIDFGDPNHFKMQVTLVNTACSDVPHFLGSALEKLEAPGKFYVVDNLSAGLEIGSDGREVGVVTRHKEHALQAAAPVVPSDIPPIPPMDQWFNVRNLPAGADLQTAINEHRVLYFPMGSYRANAPLTLKPDTVLIGLHCTRTTVSAIATPPGGSCFVTGMGFSAIGQAPNILWNSGEKSAMDDIAFGGGGGGGGGGRGGPGGPGGFGAPGAPTTGRGPATATGPGPATGTAPAGGRGGFGGRGGAGAPGAAGAPGGMGAPGGRGPADAAGGAGERAPYVLVNNGGGGVFRNVWIEGGGLSTGLRVENTSTPAKIYQLSNEHHGRVEVVFRNVQNWEIHCLQTEEESGNQNTFAGEIENCQNLLFANNYHYRVSRTANPKTYAWQIRNSDNIVFDDMHVFSQTRLSFDNTVLEEGSGVTVRANNFTHLVVSKSMKKGEPLPMPAAFASGAKLEKLASDFGNATSLTADDSGRIYFTDANQAKILRWNAVEKKADLLDTLGGGIQPQVMGFVKPSTLLVAAFAPGARQVGAIGYLDVNDGKPSQAITEVAAPKPGTALMLPVGLHNRMDIMQDYINHRGYNFRSGSNTAVISIIENEHRGYFYPPNSNVALMAGGTGRPLMQACQMAIVEPGQSVYVTSEDDCRTWLATLEKDLKLTTKLFADRGGTSVVADAAGNVYIAGDQVFVYNKDGKQIGILEVPERPSSLCFGGADKKTLFIGARGGLYSIQTAAAGK